tara:strand:+ start:129 stop:494 length:366 start_codon:yes stop_codon:yes gene_type:complete
MTIIKYIFFTLFIGFALSKTVQAENIDAITIAKIQSHISKCWEPPPPSFLEIKNVIILKISLNKDLSVSRVHIQNKENFLNNPRFIITAESARRAVLRCSPLPLKKSYYKTLKEFEMEFKY